MWEGKVTRYSHLKTNPTTVHQQQKQWVFSVAEEHLLGMFNKIVNYSDLDIQDINHWLEVDNYNMINN